jgi:uncharacterized damage-inducible protein DinB
MNELGQALIAESAHAAPDKIVAALADELANRAVPGAPHTIYQELWHLTFWQQISLDWIAGIETPCPATNEDSFPTNAQQAAEPWAELRRRCIEGTEQAASIASDAARLSRDVRCPSRSGRPVRVMSVQDQLISLAAHNAYHFGRIVLLRQLLGAWPPPSGGFSW